ncbi:sugar transferase [Anabaena catenula]|uniref:Sugar transferase n=1 Tax=Anabaena catenula FACHB-362 TaxID=2692877 RepID=A0ABR8IXY4_9NOST|nr:sugar transferase [Anabaena catenula]MBD2690450.1 sugar transferase [Anabaena catenula FACHB-362]
MDNQSLLSNSLSEAELDLRAPSFARIRKGKWWLRSVILTSVDTTLLSIAWISSQYRLPWVGQNKYSAMLIAIFIQIASLYFQGNYEPGTKRANYGNIIKTLFFAHSVILMFSFLYQPIEDMKQPTLMIFWLMSTSFVCAGRLAINIGLEYLRKKKGIGCNPVFIICDAQDKEQVFSFIKKENRYIIAGSDNSKCLDKDNRQKTLETLNKLGVTEVFISWSAIQDRMFLCWLFQASGITLHLLPVELKAIYRDIEIHNVGGMNCLSFMCPVIIGKDFWIKRIFDVCFATLFLIFTFPVYLTIAIAIKLDSPGSVFYRQTRIGLHGKKFKVWKFRTMRPDADKLQKELEALNEVKDGIIFKIKDDPRITRVGKFLRRYSLDELPQLFNVVLGEMSLVGPRPLPIRDVDKFSERHFIRQEVLPGVTGMWQVSGRSDILDFEQIIKLDLRYIENWSLLLDFQILLKTVQVVLNKEGAY